MSATHLPFWTQMQSAAVGGVFPVAVADLLASTALPGWLTLTRAGQATMFDAAGKLTYAPNNILRNSATLSTQNVTTHAINYLLSFKGDGSVALSGSATGALAGTGAGERVDLKFTAAEGTLTLTVAGSVVNARLSAVTYETAMRASDDVDTTSAAHYGPRVGYNPATLAPRGVLTENARTNELTYSNNFANAAWGKAAGLVVGANAETGPDGLLSATKLQETEVTTSFALSRNPTASFSTTYTFTIFAKAAERTALGVNFSASNARAYFDLAAGTVLLSAGPALVAASIDSAGSGGWWRCCITLTTPASGSNLLYHAVLPASGSNGTYAGVSGYGVLVFGAQLEAGAFATTYIPTGSTTLTRAAEIKAVLAYATSPAILQYGSILNASRARKKLAAGSDILSEQNEWLEKLAVYPVGAPDAWLDSHLTVDGPW